MVTKTEVEDIIRKKQLLIKGLEENIFKDFTEVEEHLLHSKHGNIKVWLKSGVGKVYEGITGAFKVGLPLIIDCNPTKAISKIIMIDWDSHMFQTIDEDWYSFEFTPVKLQDLTTLINDQKIY